jgi:glycosyltransferase involved in cell wall biosynthesis
VGFLGSFSGISIAQIGSVPHPSVVPVALFMSRFVPGGTENQMIELSRRLDRRRFAVHVACFHREGAWLGRVEQRAESIEEFPIDGFARPSTIHQMRRFARWCRERDVAVVHTTDLYANIFGLPAAALAGVPVRIGNRRELTMGKSAGLLALQRIGYSFAHRVVANSRAAAARLEYERVSADHISIIPNGVDQHAFEPSTPRAARRRIVTVANLRPEKAHDVLMDAAAIVLTTHPDAEFWCVGGGVLADHLPAEAARRGLGGRVRFLGHRDDVPKMLAEADIFVLPSRSEAMPNGVVEAMAAGLPIVATRVGGIPEVIVDGHTGLLVPPDDAAALSRALLRLIDDPALATSLGRAARHVVEQRFSFDRMVAGFEQLYLSELLSRAPRLAADAEWQPS